MRKLSVQRRRLVGLSASMAALSGVVPLLLRNHARLWWVWLCAMAAVLVWVIARLSKLNCEES
jgi:hypothetical protein